MQPREGRLMTRGSIREQNGREEVQTGDPDSGGGRVLLQHGQPAHGQSSQTLEECVYVPSAWPAGSWAVIAEHMGK